MIQQSQRKVGEKVRLRRQAAGFSQRVLADRADIDQQYVARVEGGHVKSPRYLHLIAAALGCQVGDLDPEFRGIEYVNTVAPVEEKSSVPRKDIDYMVAELERQAGLLNAKFGFTPTVRQTFDYFVTQKEKAMA